MKLKTDGCKTIQPPWHWKCWTVDVLSVDGYQAGVNHLYSDASQLSDGRAEGQNTLAVHRGSTTHHSNHPCWVKSEDRFSSRKPQAMAILMCEHQYIRDHRHGHLRYWRAHHDFCG